MQCWSVILAAGSGTRLAHATQGVKKQFLTWNAAPLYWHCALTFSRVTRVRGLIFVFPEAEFKTAHAELAERDRLRVLGLPWHAVVGGARRQDSVYNGLQALPDACDTVLVHDAARPFMTPLLVNRLLDALNDSPEALGVIPALPVTDTIKVVEDTMVRATPDRSALRAVQTPQVFSRAVLCAAHNAAKQQEFTMTDDASALEKAGATVITVEGEPGNQKITTAEDLAMLTTTLSTAHTMHPVTGWGYDVHRYCAEGAGRPMKLGGIPIPGAPDVVAHSDGDVLLHALTDAVLGCIGGGDIGERFPDSAPEWDNIASGILLNEVLDAADRAGLQLVNVDVTIIAQVPKVAPWKAQIRKHLAGLLKLDISQVNVKATTEEKLGFTGEKKGIKAVATVSALRPAP